MIVKNEFKIFIDKIDNIISQYNVLVKKSNTIENVCKRIDYCLLASIYIEDAQKLYLKIPRNNEDIVLQVIDFDYKISDFAYRIFKALNNFYLFCVKLDTKTEYGKVYGQQSEVFKNIEKSKLKMLFISSRWNNKNIMEIWDLNRPNKKKKLPRRLPLLKDVIACFDRVLAVKMGITFEDGFIPNKLVICLPPSSGKTYCANTYNLLSLALHLIYFYETGIIRMTNTAPNAQDYGKQVADMIKNFIELKVNNEIIRFYPFLEIFPEFKDKVKVTELSKNTVQYKMEDLFERDSTEKIKLRGSSSECTDSIFMFGVEASINGKRSQLGAVCDDLSGGISDIDNDELHKKITDKIKSDVSDRSNDDDCPLILMGTMYNEFDYQNTYVEEWSNEGLIQHPFLKNVRYTKDGKSAVCLVDIEDKNGKSVAPELYSNEKLQEKRDYFAKRGKPYVYNLIYRQKRDSREPKTFAYEYLKTYSKLPKELDKESTAMCDTTRKSGSDFFALPFFRYSSEENLYYLTDIIFKQKSLGTDYDPKNEFAKSICKKLISLNTIECCIESNTSNTTTSLLKQICKELGHNACKFRNAYTTNRKGGTKITRILEHEDSIKNNIIFPDQKAIKNNEMFQFMRYLTNWSSKNGQNKSNPDDAPDSLALFDNNFIHKKSSLGKMQQVPKGFMGY